MDDKTKVQACWKALAPLARQATRILDGWRKYSRQAERLNELQQRAPAACARSAYPQEDGEPHWAIVRRINDLRAEPTRLYERAAAVLLDLEGVLPLGKIEALEQEIDRSSVRRTCQGILTAAKYLNERCGPAPAGWPGSHAGGPGVLLDDSVIDALEEQVKEMETRQQEIDVKEQKRSQREQAEARRQAERQRRERVEVHPRAPAEQQTQETLLERVRGWKAEGKKPMEIKPVIIPVLRQMLEKKVAPERLEEEVERYWENLRRGLYRKNDNKI